MLARHVFKEFIVKDEPHHMAKSNYDPDAWHTIFEFSNGSRVSVVSGEFAHSDENRPYEAYIISDVKDDWSGDPWGYLDEFDLIGVLHKIKESEDLNGIPK